MKHSSALKVCAIITIILINYHGELNTTILSTFPPSLHDVLTARNYRYYELYRRNTCWFVRENARTDAEIKC